MSLRKEVLAWALGVLGTGPKATLCLLTLLWDSASYLQKEELGLTVLQYPSPDAPRIYNLEYNASLLIR